MTEKKLVDGQRLLNNIHELQEDRNKIAAALNDERNDGRDAERIFEAILYNLDYTRVKNNIKSMAELIVANLDTEIISLKKKFEEL